MRKIIFFKILSQALLIIIMNFTLAFPVFAAEGSPSADIKSKLEELKKEIASKAAVLKQDVDKKLTNKAYVGKIKTKSPAAITLASKNGPSIINITQDTEIISQVKGKKYSQKLLSEEDYIAALGDIDENQVLTAKKVILLPTTNSQPKTYLWGQIAAISDERSSSTSKLITLKGRNLKNVSVSLPDQKVKLNDFVILTGVKNEPSSSSSKNDGIFEAGFVYVIPQGGFLKPKKIVHPAPTGAGATPSATPKPSTR